MPINAEEYIEKLKLERHVEGGYFGLFYKSTDEVAPLHPRYKKPFTKITDLEGESVDKEKEVDVQRSAGTSIYFLLNSNDFSAWHALLSDEIWHHYDGSPLHIHVIDEKGELRTYLLGNPCSTPGASFQVVIKAGWWFAAEVVDKSSFGLVGCTVSPGFEYGDFVLANRTDLVQQFSRYIDIISRLTRNEKRR